MCKIDINKDKCNKVFLIQLENALFARDYLFKRTLQYWILKTFAFIVLSVLRLKRLKE